MSERWLWMTALLFAVIVTNTQSQDECPSGWFNVTWIMAVDKIAPVEISQQFFDPSLTYFREVLKYSDQQIEDTTEKAISFYKRRFGLDFSQSPVTPQGFRIYENATMYPVRVPLDVVATYNRWIVNGREGNTRCFNMKEGGYQVLFTGSQTVYGTYGGEQGQVLTPEEELGYNFFSTNFCEHTPTIILCGSISPTFRDPYGFGIRHWECFNQYLGRGLVTGAQGQLRTGDPNTIRLLIRHIMTFPATATPGYLDELGL